MLDISNLKVWYTKQEPALHNVSLSLNKGETLGIVGRSGAGKTTLLKTLVRLLPLHARVEGKILRDEQDILKLSAKDFNPLRGKALALLPQNAQASLNPFLKIKKIVAEGIQKHQGIRNKYAMKEARRIINLMGLPSGCADSYPSQLSGGMRTRAALAALFACNADYYLLDEPTNGLDIIAQEKLAELLNKIKKLKNAGMLIVSHELPFVWQVCDQLVFLEKGSIVEEIKKGDSGFHSALAGKFIKSIPTINY
jgi:peptide/nickel transport system ATP-binding protein